MPGVAGAPADLFRHVQYFINDDVDETTRKEITRLLASGGAEETSLSSDTDGPDGDSRFPLASTTHVLAMTDDFPEYPLCREPTKVDRQSNQDGPVVVTPEWVRRSARLNILQRESHFSCLRSMLFSGFCITATSSAIGRADRELLSKVVEAHGGVWTDDAAPDVTIVLTASLKARKVRKMLGHGFTHFAVVAPQWINDSWRAQKLLPLDRTYCFDTTSGEAPSCLTHPAQSSGSRSPSSSPPKKYSRMTGPSNVSMGNVFKTKTLLLSRDICRASGHQVKTLEVLIERAGGSVRRAPAELSSISQSVRNSDLIICRYREVQEFREAIRQNKVVANLSWLVQCLARDQWTEPRDEPMHFPVPKGGVPEFLGRKMTVTNYRNERRPYVTKLIKLMGATFDGSLTSQTSLVVAATMASDKARKAKEWGIPIVNHKYLVDCYLAWQKLNHTNMKYIDFPEDHDYNNEVGTGRITDESLGPWIKDAMENDEPEDFPVSDGLASEDVSRYLSSDPIPVPAQPEDLVDVPAVEPEETKDVQIEEATVEGENAVGEKAEEEVEAVEGREAGKVTSREEDMDGRENDAQLEGVTDRNENKDSDGVARVVLCDLDESFSNLPSPSKPSKRKRSDTQTESKEEQKRSRRGTVEKENEEREPSPSALLSSPRVKNGIGSGQKRKDSLLVVTSNHTIPPAQITKLKALGIEVVKDIEEADILITPGMSRTPKMLFAIASGEIEILNPSWINDCIKAKQAVGTKAEHHLRDPKGEKTYGVNLASVLERRRETYPQGLFFGHKFWVSRGVDGTIRQLIVAAGGEILEARDEDELVTDPEHYHLIADESHTQEWRDLIGRISPHNGEPLKIYKKQFVTDSLLHQSLDWASNHIDLNSVSIKGSPTPTKSSGHSRRSNGAPSSPSSASVANTTPACRGNRGRTSL